MSDESPCDLWVCPTHGWPEGTCPTCSVVRQTDDDLSYRPGELARIIAIIVQQTKEGKRG